MLSFDTYNLRARVAPVFVVLTPLILAISAWVPDALLVKAGGAAVIVSIGLSMLMAQFGRDFGKRQEQPLWEGWGGAPTTQLLRHRNVQFNRVIRGRYHRRLLELDPELRLPTEEEETKDPGGADRLYGAATRFLIGRTRDGKKFPLIFKENVNYGFRRNLWGLRPFGLLASTVGVGACALSAWFSYKGGRTVSAEDLVGSLMSLALLFMWILWVTPSTVRVAADAYAERLFEACDQVQGN